MYIFIESIVQQYSSRGNQAVTVTAQIEIDLDSTFAVCSNYVISYCLNGFRRLSCNHSLVKICFQIQLMTNFLNLTQKNIFSNKYLKSNRRNFYPTAAPFFSSSLIIFRESGV